MRDNFFPENTSDLSDEEWIKYCCLTWCNNSLNANSGYLRNVLNSYENYGTKNIVLVDRRILEDAVLYMDRAQCVIVYLLDQLDHIDDNDLVSRQAVLSLAKIIYVKEVGFRHRSIDPDDVRALPSANTVMKGGDNA